MKPWYVTLALQFSQNTITLLIIYHEQSQFLPVDVKKMHKHDHVF